MTLHGPVASSAYLAARRIVLVEDNPADAYRFGDWLGLRHGSDVELHTAETLGSAIPLIDDVLPDVIVLDLGLPDTEGLEGVRRLRKAYPATALVVLTGSEDAEIGPAAVKLGAQEYLQKDEATAPQVRRSLRYAVERQNLSAELVSTTHSLRQREADLLRLLQLDRDGMLVLGAQGDLVYANAAARDILGTDPWSLPRHDLRSLSGSPVEQEGEWVKPDGARVPIAWHVVPLVWQGQEGKLVSIRDLTNVRLAEQAALDKERALLQAQKMEAVGALAGGVAHDFNNLLTILFGRMQLLDLATKENEVAQAQVTVLHNCIQQATHLTRQLLAASRQHLGEPTCIEADPVLTELMPMLKASLGDGVRFEVTPTEEPMVLRFPEGALEQVLVNMALNARDAMEGRGTLSLALQRVGPAERMAQANGEAATTDAWRFTVSDDGPGMPDEVRRRIFEPFFTTKPKGRGLGLASVYALLSHVGGAIEVESTPGQGTTFQFEIPTWVGERGHLRGAETRAQAPLNLHTCLLVDDRPDVRAIVEELLKGIGLHVTPAEDPHHALELAQATAYDVVVTDVMMPDMTGPDLARHLGELRPDQRVLFISGYTGETFDENTLQGPHRAMLHKPFTMDGLRAALASLQ